MASEAAGGGVPAISSIASAEDVEHDERMIMVGYLPSSIFVLGR